ncbi:hypothetical protein N300_12226, partial [Calypte anna]
VSTQTEPLKMDAAVQASGCAECLSLELTSEDSVCVRCEQVNDLLYMVAELKEEVERLRSIRDSEREIDWWSRTLSTAKEIQKESVKPCPSSDQTVVADQVDGGEWKQVRHRKGKRISPQPPPPPQVSLKNTYEALDSENEAEARQEEDLSGRSPACPLSTRRVTTTATKKRRRVVVVGDSLLRGTEGPICRPDPSHREVCCLPGARVRDISRRLPQLIQPSDYYPLLVVQAGSDDIAGRSTKVIKKDFKALGRLVDGSGAQVVFASVPAIEDLNEERTRKTNLINRWLRDWCHRRNFGFFDHGTTSVLPSVLKTDGLHLTNKGKRTLAYKLERLIRRALN